MYSVDGDGGVVGQDSNAIRCVERINQQCQRKNSGGDGKECGRKHGSEKPVIVFAADAGVEPHAVMVKARHAFVTVATVFAGETYVDLTEITVYTVL